MDAASACSADETLGTSPPSPIKPLQMLETRHLMKLIFEPRLGMGLEPSLAVFVPREFTARSLTTPS
jgi:hypothetical protein